MGDRRALGLLLGGLGVLLLGPVAIASILVGAADLSVSQVLAALASGLRLGPPIEESAAQIVLELRLPRVLLGGFVGAALAMAGTCLQAVLRSPLADPYVLGVSSGATVGATVAVLFGLDAWFFGAGVAVLGFSTAILALLLVHSVARIGRQVGATRLLLAGVATSSFATALTGLVLVLIPEATSVRGLVFWLLGGLSGAEWGSAVVAGAVTLLAGGGLIALARWLDLLLLGDDAARALGLEVARARGILVLLASLLTAAAVAFSGTIAFIGLVVPHILRPLAGPGHRRLLPLAALFGASLLIALDTLARTIAAPRELPVGVLSGLLGAPFFLWFLRRARVELEGRG